jgi:hypothetical protein
MKKAEVLMHREKVHVPGERSASENRALLMWVKPSPTHVLVKIHVSYI